MMMGYVLVIPWPSVVLGIYTTGVARGINPYRQQLGHGMSGLYYVTMASNATHPVHGVQVHDLITS